MIDAFLAVFAVVGFIFLGYILTFGAYHLIVWVGEGNLKDLIDSIFGEYHD